MDGNVLHIRASSDVNTNFVAYDEARAAVWRAVSGVLDAAGISGEHVAHFVSALIGPQFGAEVFGALIPHAAYHYYGERDVVFARAGITPPHGVAVVAATGATAFGVRADDGRQMSVGGWGTLLGDEGSAYAAGLLGLRAAARAYERRLDAPTGLIEAVCEHFHVPRATFQRDLVHLAYQKPLSRAEIAGFAAVVARLATTGDAAAVRIMQKVAADLTALMLHVARKLFIPAEAFDVAAAGGLLNAGEIIVAPLRDALAHEFPHARFTIGVEEPAVALGRLMLHKM